MVLLRQRAPGRRLRVLLAAVLWPGREAGAGGRRGQTSWSIGRGGPLEASVVEQDGVLSWGSVAWSGGADCADKLRLGPLFAVKMKKRGIVSSTECTLKQAVSSLEDGSGVSATLRCPKKLLVEWTATLQQLPFDLGSAVRVRITLSGQKVQSLAGLLLSSGPCTATELTGTVDGSPVRVGSSGRFIVGVEHPLAKHHVGDNATEWDGDAEYAMVAELPHLAEVEQKGKATSYGAVILAVAEGATQGRRAFASYLSAARPEGSWQGPMVHYNSWYDFTSWQDEGFFGKDPKWADMLAQLRKEPMCEEGALKRVGGFRELTSRGVTLDSFLWDDGWDDPYALWEFNRTRFPNGFREVAKKAQELGAGLGVWLSPWGGYGSAKDERVRLGREQGFETNEHGLSLAGPRYAARFGEAVQRFRRESRVNMFKFDGVAGDPSDLPAECEAILQIAATIREESKRGGNDSGDGGQGTPEVKDGTVGDDEAVGREAGEQAASKRKDSFWINLTTGTWPSPFFLLWVDSIWRGHTDTNVPRWPALEGLSRRQRWQVWRECVVHELVVKRAELFPLAHLMMHGVVLASHGDALANGLYSMEAFDWAQEVWSLAAMGLQLQELYVSASRMRPEAWDELAAALRWARAEADVLQDAHWAIPADGCRGGNETKAFKPYAVASFKPADSPEDAGGKGFVMLRNPRKKKQKSASFTLASALELPAAMARKRIILGTVRRMAESLDANDAALDCAAFGAKASLVGPGRCAVAAAEPLKVRLLPGELIVLEAAVVEGTGESKPYRSTEL